MTIDPSTEIIALEHDSEEENIKLAKAEYERVYLDHERSVGTVRTHDDNVVVFYKDKFEHAFFKSRDRSRFKDDKSVFDLERGKRVRWIKSVIEARFLSVECWEIHRTTGHDRRFYVYWEDHYIVWLIARKAGGFRFETAYCCPGETIRRYIQGARRIEIPRD